MLKPGALYWGQEMCLTDKFDPDDPRHRALEQDLRYGIALKDIATMGEVNRALEAAGFEVVEGMDRGAAGRERRERRERFDHAVVPAHDDRGRHAGQALSAGFH